MVWAVVAATVVTAGVGLYEGSQNRKVANTALGMQQTDFAEQQQYASQLQNLIANPSQVTSLPGYQFMFDQGQQAVQRSSAAGGFLNSGNEGAALTQYGQGFATNALNQQEQLLASLSGLQASSSGAQNTAAATGAANSSNAQLNQLLSQLGLAAGTFGKSSSPGASSGTPGAAYGSPGTVNTGSGGFDDVYGTGGIAPPPPPSSGEPITG
jgi:hypothetical protein